MQQNRKPQPNAFFTGFLNAAILMVIGLSTAYFVPRILSHFITTNQLFLALTTITATVCALAVAVATLLFCADMEEPNRLGRKVKAAMDKTDAPQP